MNLIDLKKHRLSKFEQIQFDINYTNVSDFDIIEIILMKGFVPMLFFTKNDIDIISFYINKEKYYQYMGNTLDLTYTYSSDDIKDNDIYISEMWHISKPQGEIIKRIDLSDKKMGIYVIDYINYLTDVFLIQNHKLINGL